MEMDISVLKWVEDLEQRVVSADLHLKVRKVSGEAVDLEIKRQILQCVFLPFVNVIGIERTPKHVCLVGTSPTSSNGYGIKHRDTDGRVSGTLKIISESFYSTLILLNNLCSRCVYY